MFPTHYLNKIKGLLLATLLPLSLQAQPYSNCTALTDAHSLDKIESDVQQWQSTHKSTAGVVYIPVVVHVVYHNNAENFSDALIELCIDEMNKNYRKLRTPVFTPRPIFDSLWADTEIEFCLATDSNGQAHTGITRRQTAAFFQAGTIENIKHYTSGGIDAWPVTDYLNIWIAPVGSSGGILLGNTVNNNIFANTGSVEGIIINSAYPNFLSQIFTHEAGHFTGLHHTFDNANELVDDTPYEGTGGHNYINSIASVCAAGDLDSNTSATEAPYWGTTDPPDMIENFMGYDRPCQFMFTKGQKQRMHAMLNLHYAGMLKTECGPSSVRATAYKNNNSKVYPNPGTGTLNITADANTPYVVYNLSGSIIAHGAVDKTITLHNLASGIYIVKTGTIYHKVIVR